MSPLTTAVVVFVSLLAAIAAGVRLGRLLPTHHRNQETKDTVKMSLGLIATTVALLLGLLIGSAKGSYDTKQGEVIQAASKVVFLDRVLSLYGPETAEIRARVRAVVNEWVRRQWSGERPSPPGADAKTTAGDSVYFDILRLSPQSDIQRSLKDQAAAMALELAELRTLMRAQSAPSISMPLLIIVAIWLVVIFLGFSMIAPGNATSILTLVISALSISGALFLILELDRPFAGLIHISSQPMLEALSHIGG
jgi:hypothetical protein